MKSEMNWMKGVSTPALVVDYEKMMNNIGTMADFARNNDVHLRPHIKTHKCPMIGHLQLKEGANGICVATVGEAEIFAQCGFDDILIANETVVPSQIERLVNLNKWCKVRACVDHPQNVEVLSDIASARDVELEVLIDLDVGMGRQGITPGERAVSLARKIAERPGLTLVGLQAYEGHLTPMMDDEQRKKKTDECMKMAVDTRDLINEEGFDINYITASGSGTFMFSAEHEGITEIQPGTYVFSDHHLRLVTKDFEIAATVLGTIQNQISEKEFTIDAGSKGIATENGKPKFKDFPHNRVRLITEEHIQFKINTKYKSDISYGQQLELIPAHICPTVNLYDFLTVKKGDEIIAKWKVMARGKNY